MNVLEYLMYIYHLFIKYVKYLGRLSGLVCTDDPLCGESIGVVVGAGDELCGVSAESIGVVKGEGDTWAMRLLQSI